MTPRVSPTGSIGIQQVSDALTTAQDALRRAVGARVEGTGFRGVDIISAFGIDAKLAWKVGRLCRSNDPFGCVRYLPGEKGWTILLNRMVRVGIETAMIDELARTFESVRRCGKAWAGESSAFTLMAAGLVKNPDPRVGLEHRRNHVISGSFVWGIRARSLVRLDILKPNPNSDNQELITIRGFVDVERLRADAPWYLEVPFCVEDDASCALPVRFSPLDSDDRSRVGPFLMKRFCSKSLPRFQTPKIERVPSVVELPVGAVGIEERFTLFHGAMVGGALPKRKSDANKVATLMLKVQTPCECVMFDTVVHRDLARPGWSPIPEVFIVLDGYRGQFSHQNRDRLPIELKPVELSPGRRSYRTDSFDQMAGLIDAAFARTGWDPAEFRHFRTELPYPPVPSALTINIPLLD
ncbi:MAG: hypothetical protein EXS03_05630 [Phycisphaerales bacterium]|nr:hypothetical protein [Phycisphaerales bacterium]